MKWIVFLKFTRYQNIEGNGNPLQYSCLENPLDGGAWWAAVYGVTQSQTLLKRLSSSRFSPWVGKIPWRRAWQPTLVFLPGKSHGQRSPLGYSPWGHKESEMTEATEHSTQKNTYTKNKITEASPIPIQLPFCTNSVEWADSLCQFSENISL